MRATLTTICLLGMAAPAYAQDDAYYYGGVQFGLTQGLEGELEGRSPNALRLEDEKALGPMLGFFFGHNVGKWRYEFEYAFRRNNYDELTVENPGSLALAVGEFDAGGKQSSSSFMVNSHYQFAEFNDWHAYAGLGLGLSRMKINSLSGNNVLAVNESLNWEPAGQAMLQLTRKFADTEYSIGVRHFRTLAGQFSTEAGRSDYKFINNEIFARFTWHFGKKEKLQPAPAPRPAPVAAPAPRPAPVVTPTPAPKPEPVAVPIPGPFLVFFDFDKTSITDDAAAIIVRAAKAFKEFGIASIEATGHADRAGSDNYNEKLANRRAEAVKARLIAEGVPASKIKTQSRGETQPLVSTEDGIREWQNRRTEIILISK